MTTKATRDVLDLAVRPVLDLQCQGGNIDGTIIGEYTPAAGTFSTLVATAGTLNGVTIGGTTPEPGTFTSLTSPLLNSFYATRPFVVLADLKPTGTHGGSTGAQVVSNTTGSPMYVGWIPRAIGTLGTGGTPPFGSGAYADPFSMIGSIVTLQQTAFSGNTNAIVELTNSEYDNYSYYFTLTEAGTYYIELEGTGCTASRCVNGIYNVTNSVMSLTGTVANGAGLNAVSVSGCITPNPTTIEGTTWPYLGVNNRVFDNSNIRGVVTISGSTQFQLQTWTNGSASAWDGTSDGYNIIDRQAFGTANNIAGILECYNLLTIVKLV